MDKSKIAIILADLAKTQYTHDNEGSYSHITFDQRR